MQHDHRRPRVGLTALVVALGVTLMAAALPAGAVGVEGVPHDGSRVGAAQFGSAVYTNYPGGYFAVRAEPLGSTWDNRAMDFTVNGVVRARCGGSGYDYPTRSGWALDTFSQPVFAIDPTMSTATGIIKGRGAASSCGGTHDFVVTFSMQGTSLPQHGEIVDPDGYVWGYLQRQGTALGEFCWDNGVCTDFGLGQSAIGYRYLVNV